MAFIRRLVRPSRDHFFLLGPRGTGKTSWCMHEYPDALRIDLLNPPVLARETQVSRKTVEGYLDVLEDLLMGYRVEVFTKRAKRELAAHPKFYFFDAGVFRSNRAVGPLDSASELDGAALEGLVAQHLRAWCDYTQTKHELYYWQTRSRVEVDFVIYGESGLYAVEVKNAKRVDSQRPDRAQTLC